MSESRSEVAVREQLSPAKRALLEKRLGRAIPAGGARQIPHRPDPAQAPLSFQQQRQWRLIEKEGAPTFYHNVVHLEGPLEVAALARALDEVVARHEVLRTTFVEEGGCVAQVIHPPRGGHMAFIDLCGLPADARATRAAELSAAQVRAFDLARGPVFRASLLHLGAEEHQLLFALLHLVSDRWSIKLLTQELGTLYAAFTADRPSPLTPLPIQYADYAHWQRQQSEDAGAAFWRERLEGYAPVLPLPTDSPRPPAQTFRGAHETLVLPATLSESLKALSRREGATLFMTALAVLKVQLASATGRADIAVATGVAGRQQGETERLIGCFINTLVMRTDLAGDPTFLEILGRVRETALWAFAHQEVPFQILLDELLPSPDPRYPPLVQVSFSLHHAARDEAATDGPAPRMSLMSVDAGRAPFDLTLRVQETGQEMICTLEYNTDLFRPETAKGMLERYRRLSECVADDAGRRLSELTKE